MSDQVMREALKNLAEGARRRGFNASSGFTTETEGGNAGKRKRFLTLSFYEEDDESDG